MHGHAIQTAHISFNKSPPLPCVKVWSQSLLLTLWLLESPLTHFWLLGFTALTCLVSGNHCCAVYTCSCPVWVHWACLTSWPSQLVEKSVSHSPAFGCPVGRCESHRVVWRALLFCNLYYHNEGIHVYVYSVHVYMRWQTQSVSVCVYSMHVHCV